MADAFHLSEGAREGEQDGSQSLFVTISEMTPYPFYSLEATHLVQLTLKGMVLHEGMATGK